MQFFKYVIPYGTLKSIINPLKQYYMEKNSIININNLDAIEVRENNRLAPRYGMNQLSFQSTREKEQVVLRKCEEIIKAKKLPLLVLKLEESGVKVQEEANDVFIVLEKAAEFLKQGFHVLIIQAMMGCAGGDKSSLGYGAFDEKFMRAHTDMGFRKDLFGTDHLLPIMVARFLLIDLMNGIDPDKAGEEDVKKSGLVNSLSHYSAKE